MYLRAIIIAGLLLCLHTKGFTQSTFSMLGARSNGLANAGSCLSDEWSLFNNIGGLAKVESNTAAFTYQLPANLPNAHRMAALVTIPTSLGVAGLGVFRFGDQLYNEQILTAGFGNQFGLASLGARINYVQYNAEGFGRKGVVSISLGGIAEIIPGIKVGAQIINLNQPEISPNEEHLPTILIAGLAITPSDKIFLSTEIEKDIEYKPLWKVGVEYRPQKKIAFRTGFNINPRASFFGTGFYARGLKIDYAIQHSVNLGFIQQASIAYQMPVK